MNTPEEEPTALYPLTRPERDALAAAAATALQEHQHENAPPPPGPLVTALAALGEPVLDGGVETNALLRGPGVGLGMMRFRLEVAPGVTPEHVSHRRLVGPWMQYRDFPDIDFVDGPPRPRSRRTR